MRVWLVELQIFSPGTGAAKSLNRAWSGVAMGRVFRDGTHLALTAVCKNRSRAKGLSDGFGCPMCSGQVFRWR
jgi:hypothetical protein